MVPAVYQLSMEQMLGGGVKSSSHTTYFKGFMEFYHTMTRLGFQDDILLNFPTLDVIIQIYITNCEVIRLKPNVFDTIRNKLRAIDYVAQLANINQSWSTNPSLAAIIAYAKKRNKSKECDTLPITAPILLQIIRYVCATKVYGGLALSDQQRRLADKWLTFSIIWRSLLKATQMVPVCHRLSPPRSPWHTGRQLLSEQGQAVRRIWHEPI